MDRLVRNGIVGLFTLLAVGCAQTAGEENVAGVGQPLDPNCTELSSEVTEHSCLHAQFGPFATVDASATRNFTGTTPNVNKGHTHFTVKLPGAAGANEGTVKYVPTETADMALYRNPKTNLLVLDAAGNSVPRLLDHVVTGCAQLTHVSVYHLTQGATYRFVIGPAQVTQVGLVVENVEEFDPQCKP